MSQEEKDKLESSKEKEEQEKSALQEALIKEKNEP